MKPGRELDALIAEKVMGWKHQDRLDMYGYHFNAIDEKGRNSNWREVEPYSTDISAALEVVEKLKVLKDCDRYDGSKEDREFVLWYLLGSYESEGPKWQAGWHVVDGMLGPYGLGDTAPHAICMAALKAVGEI